MTNAARVTTARERELLEQLRRLKRIGDEVLDAAYHIKGLEATREDFAEFNRAARTWRAWSE